MRTRPRQGTCAASGPLLVVWLLAAAQAIGGGEPAAGLELRQFLPPKHDSLAATGTPIPHDAVRVFVHEGAPLGVHVTAEHIAVDYLRSGVLLDRPTGNPIRRFTTADRWRRVDRIDGKPVRWVSLLQSVGDELWVGFREGSGVAGDKVAYGMGIYPGEYGPWAVSMVLARLADGKWRSFTRPVGPQPPPPQGVLATAEEPPTERPHRVARSGDHAILFSTTRSRRRSGNWDVELDGHLSLLDLKTGQWRLYDADKDLDADGLHELIVQDGEILVTGNRGAHRWDAKAQAWRFLDPQCALRNPALSAATPVGDELWVGYANQSFGVIGQQGISRFNEKTGTWTHMVPRELGTACPVRSIAALAKDDVWVLFKPRPWHGAAIERPYYPREGRTPRPTGLGRFADGKWIFPVELPGVPDTAVPKPGTAVRGRLEAWAMEFPGPSVQHLVTVGGKLFVGGPGGLFVGPGKWTQLTPHPVRHLAPASDSKALDVECDDPSSTTRETILRGQYDPASGRLTLERVVPKEHFFDRAALLAHPQDARWKQTWVRIPTSRRGEWAVGPLGNRAYHAVVETPAAVWIASQGELTRLDRERLAEWLGE